MVKTLGTKFKNGWKAFMADVTVGAGTPAERVVIIPDQPKEGFKQKLEEIAAGAVVEAITTDHEHQWRKGMLPGNKFTKSCKVCGVVETVTDHALWQTLPN